MNAGELEHAPIFEDNASRLPAERLNVPTVFLETKGMTCEACAAHIQNELDTLPCETGVSVNYEEA